MAIMAVITIKLGAIGLSRNTRVHGGDTVVIQQTGNGDMQIQVSSPSGRQEGHAEVVTREHVIQTGTRPPRPDEIPIRPPQPPRPPRPPTNGGGRP
jgi:hypothetical protein